MKRRLVKGLVATMICLTMVSSMVGCGKKDTRDYKSEYTRLYYAYQDLLANQTGAGITCQPTGTGQFAMNVEDSLVVFPSQFGYPSALTGVPGYTVKFNNDDCSITPPSGWEVTSTGSVIYVYNKEQMVQGQFVPGRIDSAGGNTAATKDTLQAYIESWFKTATTNYSFSDIYLGDSSQAGVSGHCIVSVDGQSYVINCGMVSDGKTTMTYMFTYAGAENTAKEDIIQSIVSTCKIGDKAVRIM